MVLCEAVYIFLRSFAFKLAASSAFFLLLLFLFYDLEPRSGWRSPRKSERLECFRNLHYSRDSEFRIHFHFTVYKSVVHEAEIGE